jgi:hypothetical protein
MADGQNLWAGSSGSNKTDSGFAVPTVAKIRQRDGVSKSLFLTICNNGARLTTWRYFSKILFIFN